MKSSVFLVCWARVLGTCRNGKSLYPATSSRTRWKQWIVAALLAAALGWAWRSLGGRIDWDRLGLVFRTIDLPWLAAACGIGLLTYIGRALRWAVLVEPVRPDPDIRQLISATLIGYAAIVVFGRPGELVRPYLIARGQSVSMASQMAAWLTERVWDLLMALLIFGIALGALNQTRLAIPPVLAGVVDASGIAVLTMTAVCLILLLGVRGLLPVLQRIAARLTARSAAAGRFASSFLIALAEAGSPARSLKMLAWSVGEWVLILLSCYALFQATQATWQARPIDVLIFMGFATFGAIVQLPGVGGGTQVAGTVILNQLFGVPSEQAFALAVLVWLCTFVVVVPLGAIAAIREGLNWSGVRTLTRAPQAELEGA